MAGADMAGLVVVTTTSSKGVWHKASSCSGPISMCTARLSDSLHGDTDCWVPNLTRAVHCVQVADQLIRPDADIATYTFFQAEALAAMVRTPACWGLL